MSAQIDQQRRTTRVQTASHWGVYDVELDRDRIVGVHPPAWDPAPSPLIEALPAVVRGPMRISQPHVRKGWLAKGPGATSDARAADAFVPVSWERALDLVAAEFRRVRGEFGHEAIYGGSYGWASAGRLHHAPSVLKRFLGLGGGFVDKIGNHSFGAALGIMPYVTGSGDVTGMASDWRAVAAHTRLMVMFGGAGLKNAQLCSGGVARHTAGDWMRRVRAAGVKFVNIGPIRGDLAQDLEARWIPIRPGTDTAFMLALAHSLLATGRADEAFLASHCTGWPKFRDYLTGASDGVVKDAAWAGAICGIEPEVIRSLAAEAAGVRTLFTMSWSVQRSDHGEQPCWALAALAAVAGQIGLPGGGFALGYAAVNGVGMPRPGRVPRPRMPLGANPVRNHIPVGRIAEMLLSPGKTVQLNGRTLTYPDIRLLHSAGGNPFHHNADLNKLVRAWKRPETIIVHDPFWTPAARHADIVLPSTTTMERNDILAPELDRHWVAMKRVIDPVGQARNDFDVFAELAERLGYRNEFDQGRDEMQWLRHMYAEAAQEARDAGYAPPDFERFWESGMFEFPEPTEPHVWLSGFRADPDKHRLGTPSGRLELWSERIAGYGYADCPPHPAWLEPAEWLGSPLAARFPLHMVSNQPRGRLHSQLDHSPVSRSHKRDGREALTIHPREAQARGIADGDTVRVFNDRGAFIATATLDDGIMPGVVQVPTGAWFDPETPGMPGSLEKHGNPNAVTLDKGTSSLAQQSCAQTVLVQVERFAGTPPRVSAFDLPRIEAE